MPLDEFTERFRKIQEHVKSKNLGALLIFGTPDDYAPLCYVSGYIPSSHYALVMIPSEGEAALLVSTFSRDLQLLRSMTCQTDVRIVNNLHANLLEWLGKNVRLRGTEKPAIGLCRSGVIIPPVYEKVADACNSFRMLDFDADVNDLMRSKRPREVAAIQRSCVVLSLALKELRRTGDAREKMIRTICKARESGATDVRLMYSTGPGEAMRQVDEKPVKRPKSLVVYLAVDVLGYWAEGFYTDSGTRIAAETKRILDLVIEESCPGVGGDSLLKTSLRGTSSPLAPHGVTMGVIGRGLGLSRKEAPILGRARKDRIRDGDVCSFHVGLEGKTQQAIVSAIVAFRDGGKRIMWRSDSM